ncbi:MAG: tetratricopeptide repeat protein [Ardenticatenaceae bacterium]
MSRITVLLLLCFIALLIVPMRWATDFRDNLVSLCVIKMTCHPEGFSVPFSESNAWLLWRDQEPDVAIETLNHFLHGHSNHLIANLRLGELYWQQGNEMEALAIWQSIPKADVYFALSSASYGKQESFSEEEWMKIEEWAEISIRIKPQPSAQKRHLYEALCAIWEEKGQPEKALPWCERKATSVRDGWSQLVLARVQSRAGYDHLAEENLLWVAEEGPPSLRGRGSQYLAGHYLQTEEFSKACFRFAQAQALGYHVNETERNRFSNCE